MLRNIKFYLSALAILVGATSCLDKYPGSSIPEKEAMRTFADAEQTLTGIYASLKSNALYSGYLTPAARHPGRPGLCRRRQHQHLRLVLALGHTPDRPAARSGLCRPLQGDRQLQLLPRPHRRGGGERDQRHQHREARTVHGRGLRRACALLYRAAQDLLQGL